MKDDDKIARRMRAIIARHRHLDHAIHNETKRVSPDMTHIKTLKKRRLAAKDQIYRLRDAVGAARMEPSPTPRPA